SLPRRQESYASFTVLFTMVCLDPEIIRQLVKLRILMERMRSKKKHQRSSTFSPAFVSKTRLSRPLTRTFRSGA
ncbi:MAG: hypothetical protein CW742_15340, partial [Methanoregula sp.]